MAELTNTRFMCGRLQVPLCQLGDLFVRVRHFDTNVINVVDEIRYVLTSFAIRANRAELASLDYQFIESIAIGTVEQYEPECQTQCMEWFINRIRRGIRTQRGRTTNSTCDMPMPLASISAAENADKRCSAILHYVDHLPPNLRKAAILKCAQMSLLPNTEFMCRRLLKRLMDKGDSYVKRRHFDPDLINVSAAIEDVLEIFAMHANNGTLACLGNQHIESIPFAELDNYEQPCLDRCLEWYENRLGRAIRTQRDRHTYATENIEPVATTRVSQLIADNADTIRFAIRHCVSRLEPDLREVAVLKCAAQTNLIPLCEPHMAAALNLTIYQVRSKWRKACKLLSKWLEPYVPAQYFILQGGLENE